MITRYTQEVDRSRKFSNPVTPRLYLPLKSIPFDMMFIMATFVHRNEQLEAVNREVKRREKEKVYFFPSACFQIVQPSFR